MGQSSSSLTPEMAAQIKTEVDTLIDEKPIVVFSKTTCPYCSAAKDFLEKKGVLSKATIIELNKRPDGRDVQNYLLEKTGQRTVPNIYIAQEHIGGYSDLSGLADERLDGLLAKI
ncbi:thioredoxin-like protein [Mortierella sp. GBAus27b]|nr:hypothetical protein BGX31_003480 [Mortierella sp. GBA43]KAI8354504.1 thioredoxin-like protein [Mortierella sp. GBAus27b]